MVAECSPPRRTLCGIGIAIGAIGGFANFLLDIDTSPASLRPGWLLASLVVVVIFHEGTHGAVAALLGLRPSFGLRPLLVYITFKEKVPRAHFIAVAIVPLVVLNLLCVLLSFYGGGRLGVYPNLCLIMNTIGSLGDMWVVLKLVRTPKGVLIQDTKAGIQVWVADDGQSALCEREGGLRHGC